MKNTTKKPNYHNTSATPSNSTATIYETSIGLHQNTKIGLISTLIKDSEYLSRYSDDSSRPPFIIQLMEQEKALWI